MKSEVISVGTTATIVAGASTDGLHSGPGSAAVPTKGLIRVPSGSVTVYFGGPGVTTSNGCPLVAGEDLEVDLVLDILYAVVATGTQNIYLLRTGD